MECLSYFGVSVLAKLMFSMLANFLTASLNEFLFTFSVLLWIFKLIGGCSNFLKFSPFSFFPNLSVFDFFFSVVDKS